MGKARDLLRVRARSERILRSSPETQKKVNLLQILKKAGIVPNDEFYSIESIVEAMKEGAGYTPGIECNNYSAGNSQLYQVYLCVHTSGKTSLSVLSFQRKDVLLKFIISH
ncbi:hypothetical protein ACFX13_011572 [Malus domestica]